MVKIKDIGDFESVPTIVNDILQGNTEALDEHLVHLSISDDSL